MNSTDDVLGPMGGSPPPPPSGSLAHDDLGPHILAAGFTTWAIAFICVALRMWTRTVIVKKLGASDWCIVFALVRGRLPLRQFGQFC